MSKKCCCNAPVSGCGGTCFGNLCNPFCLVVLLLALKKGEIIKSDNTIEALFFLFLLLCCCGNKSANAGFGCGC